NHYLSLDPYMRGRMNDSRSYAAPQPLGQVMVGGTAGEVVESRNPDYLVGDRVVARGGWQEYSVLDASSASGLRKVDNRRIGLSHYLGAVGMPGIAAWVGLVRICAPQAGQTVVVSAATGAVGSAVGALAKARSCHTVGIAGGPEKCAYAVRELGFDACLDYKQHEHAESLSRALAEACPNGIDHYFENVGGMVQNAVMPLMNAHGRVAACGMVASYDAASVPMAQPQLILTSRLLLQGFTVGEYTDQWPAALQELTALVASGRLRPRESVAQGIAEAPAAFLGLLKGRNLGKQLVKLI
ncbi:MAG: NADP-dependent oxidoreductase, partial [Burkholderiaceae bacterium]